MTDRSWMLMQGDAHIGTLLLDHIDQPWFHCRFTATPAWEPLAPTLAAWTSAVENKDSNDFDIAKSFEDVRALRLFLVSVAEEEQIDPFLIHIVGDSARFRY